MAGLALVEDDRTLGSITSGQSRCRQGSNTQGNNCENGLGHSASQVRELQLHSHIQPTTQFQICATKSIMPFLQ
jgi:hypothetical protein